MSLSTQGVTLPWNMPLVLGFDGFWNIRSSLVEKPKDFVSKIQRVNIAPRALACDWRLAGGLLLFLALILPFRCMGGHAALLCKSI